MPGILGLKAWPSDYEYRHLITGSWVAGPALFGKGRLLLLTPQDGDPSDGGWYRWAWPCWEQCIAVQVISVLLQSLAGRTNTTQITSFRLGTTSGCAS